MEVSTLTFVTSVRTRSKSDRTRARIIAAAGPLFAAEGFDAVATQRISDAAGIAAGTLFRYAATKGELLLMVLNDRFAEAIDTGIRDAATEASGIDALYALAAPVVDSAATHAETTAQYQSALFYGPSGEAHRDRGRELVKKWRSEAARLLGAAVGVEPDREDVGGAADALLAVMSMTVADLTQARRHAGLRGQFGVILAGLSVVVRASRAPTTNEAVPEQDVNERIQ